MMRALFSGVSGLKTHQTRMDVIGNNIANVNTVGYKSSSMQFQDTVSQTLQSATGPNEATGRAGMNARQIGLGVNTAAIYSNITAAGAPETTGNPFDVRLNGDSFFVVSDGSNQYYTRSGAFTVDTNGTLAMQSNGYTVQGYGTTTQMVNGAQEITIDTSSLTSLDIMSKENSTYEAAATTNAYITGIIDDSDSNVSTRNGHGLTMEVYDNRGNAYTIRLRISNQNWTAADPASTKTSGTYYISVSDIIGPDKKSIVTQNDGETTAQYEQRKTNFFNSLNFFSSAQATTTGTPPVTTVAEVAATNALAINFNTTNGKISGPLINSTVDRGDADNPSKGCGFTFNMKLLAGIVESPTGVTNTAGTGVTPTASTAGTAGSIAWTGAGGEAVTLAANDAFTEQIQFDLSTLLNVGNKGTSTANGAKGGTNSTAGSGWTVGNLHALTIGTDGKINGSYSNGQTKLLGQIATATFSNASGLEKQGDNLFGSTLNSGEAVIGDVTASGGSMQTGELEMSNVDLAAQFTTMITTQRGFQANSRIISVSDQILEELVNLKR